MPKRIFLVHPTPLAMAPIDQAFKTLWQPPLGAERPKTGFMLPIPMAGRPRVALIGTGGTISSIGRDGLDV